MSRAEWGAYLLAVAGVLCALVGLAKAADPPEILIDGSPSAIKHDASLGGAAHPSQPAALRAKPSPIVCVPQRHERPGALDKEGWNPV